MRKRLKAMLVTLVFVASCSDMVVACGLNWNAPHSHFDGVGSKGNVLHTEEMGEINIGSGVKLPLRAIFRSDNSAVSPYVGYGWEVPLLESRIIQLDEQWFQVTEPTGWYRLFWRDKKHPDILHGQNSWKGEIRGEKINIWANCGTKICFTKGRISMLFIQGYQLDYLYKNNQVQSIRVGVNTIIKTESGENERAFVLPDNKRIEIKLTDRPRVEMIGGQTLVSEKCKALSKIVCENHSTGSIRYGIDEFGKPNIKWENRSITWNPGSGIIESDGAWRYYVKLNPSSIKDLTIGRKTNSGKHEFWHHNKLIGREVEMRDDGTQLITSRFSGSSTGQIRKIEKITKGKIEMVYRAAYDELGRIVRERKIDEKTGDVREIWSSYKGDMVFQTIYLNDGVVNSIRRSDRNGNMLIELNRNNEKSVYTIYK